MMDEGGSKNYDPWNVEKAAETETFRDTRSSLLRGFSI